MNRKRLWNNELHQIGILGLRTLAWIYAARVRPGRLGSRYGKFSRRRGGGEEGAEHWIFTVRGACRRERLSTPTASELSADVRTPPRPEGKGNARRRRRRIGRRDCRSRSALRRCRARRGSSAIPLRRASEACR